jgi:antimicrobial peptide system SdpB family protein
MDNVNQNAWQRFVAYCARERFLVGASLFRIIAGVGILYQYLINYEQRHYLFGPNGVMPFNDFVAETGSGFSIYVWARTPLVFELLFHLGLVVAVLFIVGWRTRLMTALNYVFWWSLHRRFSVLWDGGDNVMQLVLVYSLFADLGAHWSFDAVRRRSRPVDPEWARLRAIAHNVAMLAFALQISLVYGVAGLTKVQGETWRNGTALYYALRAGEFALPGYSEMIFHNSFLLTALAYCTVAFQVSFPFLLFMNRRTRTLMVLAGLTFHLGIAIFMGLITFATFLIAVDLSLIDDDEYEVLFRIGRGLGERARAWMATARARALPQRA